MGGGSDTAPLLPPRLNPFAFPSETTQRTILLCVFVLCGTGALYGHLPNRSEAEIAECVAASWAGISDLREALTADPTHADGAVDVFRSLARCAEMMRPSAIVRLSGMGLTLLVAGILFFLWPVWIGRNRRLEPFDRTGPQDVARELEDLSGRAGLAGAIDFEWNPVARWLPIVFDRSSGHRVALSGRFVVRHYQDLSGFRAIVLHELAHVRNGDVAKTYIALSLVLAFCLVALLPSVLLCGWLLATASWIEAGILALQATLWSAAVLLSGASVLRLREYYADVRASVWTPVSAVDHALAELPLPPGGGLGSILRLHPDPRNRRSTLRDPGRLFGIGPLEAFGIGLAAWSSMNVLEALFFVFIPMDSPGGMVAANLSRVVVFGAVFVTAIGAIGIGVWREAFASLTRGTEPGGGAAWLGVALAAGGIPPLLLQLAATPGLSEAIQDEAIRSVGMDLSIQFGVMLSSMLVFGWIAAVASAWFPRVLRSRSAILVMVSTVATPLVFMLVAGVCVAFAVYLSLFVTVWQGRWTEVVYAYAWALGPPVIVAAVIACAIPLAATQEADRHRGRPPAHWVFLDGAVPLVPEQAPLRPGGAMRIGAVVGLLFWLLWMLLYFRHDLPPAADTAIWSGWLAFSGSVEHATGNPGFVLPATAALVQALAALISAASTRRLGVVHGICSALTAGLVIFVGDMLFFTISYQSPAPNITAGLVKLGLGSVLAIPAAILGALARRLLGPGDIGDQPGRLSTAVKAAVAALCLVVGLGMAKRIQEQVVVMLDINATRNLAEAGDANAQYRLGDMYASAAGLPQDDAAAAEWWTRAAAQGHAAGQYGLAMLHLYGRGVPQDDARAFEGIRLAAEQGHVEAARMLGWLYSEGRGAARDPALAREWFRIAAERGDAVAGNSLGLLLALGVGGRQDDGEAVLWFRQAAELGLADAQANLGFMYLQGRGIPTDESLAFEWLHRAAEAGHAEAAFQVGEMLRTGTGTAPDAQLAVTWLRRAAEQGYAGAVPSLSELCQGGLTEAC